jgi:hypothetical protein
MAFGAGPLAVDLASRPSRGSRRPPPSKTRTGRSPRRRSTNTTPIVAEAMELDKQAAKAGTAEGNHTTVAERLSYYQEGDRPPMRFARTALDPRGDVARRAVRRVGHVQEAPGVGRAAVTPRRVPNRPGHPDLASRRGPALRRGRVRRPPHRGHHPVIAPAQPSGCPTSTATAGRRSPSGRSSRTSPSTPTRSSTSPRRRAGQGVGLARGQAVDVGLRRRRPQEAVELRDRGQDGLRRDDRDLVRGDPEVARPAAGAPLVHRQPGPPTSSRSRKRTSSSTATAPGRTCRACSTRTTAALDISAHGGMDNLDALRRAKRLIRTGLSRLPATG